MADFTGQTFGKYELNERLGRGGMADVYRAYQPGLDRFVAVKTMHGHLADSPEFVSRFKREAQSVAQLRHAHIVQVIDFDVEDDVYYMVMEYIQGDTLKAYVSQKGVLPIPESLHLAGQLIDALDYAHENGMIHRDIKPANIMFTDGGFSHLVLTDFGIARILDASGLTMSGMTVGTPAYMSPEAGRGEKVDERGDLYSAGIVLYEMLTGQVPFEADTPYAIIMKHINDPLPSPRQINAQLPESVERLLLKALVKNPDDRFQTAAEFRKGIRWVQKNLSHELPTKVRAAKTAEAPDPATVELSRPAAATTTVEEPTARLAPPIRVVKPAKRPRSKVRTAVVVVLIVIVALMILSGNEERSSRRGTPTPAPQTDQNTSDQSGLDESAQSLFENGLLNAEEGAYVEAIRDYTSAIDLDPDRAAYYESRGWAFLELNNLDEAIADFTQAIERAPNNSEFYGARGWAYYSQEEYALAAEDFEQAARLDPDNHDIYETLGNAYFELGQFRRALLTYRRYLELTGDSASGEIVERVSRLVERLGDPSSNADIPSDGG